MMLDREFRTSPKSYKIHNLILELLLTNKIVERACGLGHVEDDIEYHKDDKDSIVEEECKKRIKVSILTHERDPHKNQGNFP